MIDLHSKEVKDSLLKRLCAKHGFLLPKWLFYYSLNSEDSQNSGMFRLRALHDAFPPHAYFSFAKSTGSFVKSKTDKTHPLDAIFDAAKHADIVADLAHIHWTILKRGTTLEQLAVELDLDREQDE